MKKCRTGDATGTPVNLSRGLCIHLDEQRNLLMLNSSLQFSINPIILTEIRTCRRACHEEYGVHSAPHFVNSRKEWLDMCLELISRIKRLNGPYGAMA